MVGASLVNFSLQDGKDFLKLDMVCLKIDIRFSLLSFRSVFISAHIFSLSLSLVIFKFIFLICAAACYRFVPVHMRMPSLLTYYWCSFWFHSLWHIAAIIPSFLHPLIRLNFSVGESNKPKHPLQKKKIMFIFSFWLVS